MSEQNLDSEFVPRIAVFDGTYREVLELLERARALAAAPRAAAAYGSRGAVAAADLSSLVRLEASCEALRVTSRLTHCLAWVLVHKAIHAGELAPDAAYDPENRLSGGAVCLALGGEANPRLPVRLRSLLADSRALYVRLARLDAGMPAIAAGA